MAKRVIKSVEDVKEFFSYLVNELGVNLHPDNEFEEYINLETGEQSFSYEECNEYNGLMETCFEVCDANGADIYEIAGDLLILVPCENIMTA